VSAPLIGISGRRWGGERISNMPPNLADAAFDLHLDAYPRCVTMAGGLPVQLASDADAHALMERLDGLVLTGGADVDPSWYDAEPHPELGETELHRDEWEMSLLRAAMAQDKPVLAICRGCQLVNVALGGTLIQHLDESELHAEWVRPRHELRHPVSLDAGSLPASVYGTAAWPVNTLHHQAIDQPGRGVRIVGRAPDGVVEAIEVDGTRVLAVQWHPEFVAAQPDPGFTWLVTESRRPSTA
jgi:putative glutamine amidotransferase